MRHNTCSEISHVWTLLIHHFNTLGWQVVFSCCLSSCITKHHQNLCIPTYQSQRQLSMSPIQKRHPSVSCLCSMIRVLYISCRNLRCCCLPFLRCASCLLHSSCSHPRVLVIVTQSTIWCSVMRTKNIIVLFLAPSTTFFRR